MSKQMRQLVETEEMNKQNLDWEAELDWIHEQEQITRVQREKEHKVAMRQVALKHALMCAIMLQ